MEFTHSGRDYNGNFIIDTQRFLTFYTYLHLLSLIPLCDLLLDKRQKVFFCRTHKYGIEEES